MQLREIICPNIYQVTELNVSRIWIKWAYQAACCCTAKFSLSRLTFMHTSGTLFWHDCVSTIFILLGFMVTWRYHPQTTIHMGPPKGRDRGWKKLLTLRTRRTAVMGCVKCRQRRRTSENHETFADVQYGCLLMIVSELCIFQDFEMRAMDGIICDNFFCSSRKLHKRSLNLFSEREVKDSVAQSEFWHAFKIAKDGIPDGWDTDMSKFRHW